jgi:hypothetical protein
MLSTYRRGQNVGEGQEKKRTKKGEKEKKKEKPPEHAVLPSQLPPV